MGRIASAALATAVVCLVVAPGAGIAQAGDAPDLSPWLARSGAAPAKPPAPPEPPASAPQTSERAAPQTPDEVDAWLDANHIDTAGWEIDAFDDDEVVLIKDDFRPPAGAVSFGVPIRAEFFKPTRPDGSEVGSMALTIEVDCVAHKGRPQDTRFYAGHAMQGRAVLAKDSGTWSSLDDGTTINARILSLCPGSKSSPAAAAAPTEGPGSLAMPDVGAWISRTVDPMKDVLAYYDAGGVYYVQGAVKDRQAGTYIVQTRGELFKSANGALSQTLQVRLNCHDHEISLGDLHAFRQHNLVGDLGSRPLDHAWRAPATSEEATQMLRMCDVAENLAEP